LNIHKSRFRLKFLSHIRTSHSEVNSPNIEHIINFLDYNLKSGLQRKLPLMDLVMTLDAYDILQLEIPYKNDVRSYLDSLQCEDGTWNTGKKHYVPSTAHILMFYLRRGFSPKRPIDSFLTKIDTWDKVVAHAEKYNGDNFWGSMWGHVYLHLLHKRQRPPWTPDFLKSIETGFKSWAYDNHQMTHVATLCFLLCEPIPRLEEVVNITVKQQNSDGGWGFFRNDSSNTRETAQTIWFLRTFQSSNSNIKTNIDKATRYVLKNYKTETYDGKTCGGFSFSVNKRIDVKSTVYGVILITGNTGPFLSWRICEENT